jgi:hypothetical protein
MSKTYVPVPWRDSSPGPDVSVADAMSTAPGRVHLSFLTLTNGPFKPITNNFISLVM